MSRHSFDPEVAELVGLNAAVIYQNIRYWCEKNEANERNIHDGKAWTYNSLSAFEKLFPYLTKKQIRVAIDKLRDSELIEVGNFNDDPRDRTSWYALKGMLHLPSRAHTNAPEGSPLPDSKPNIKHTPIPPKGDCDLFSANEETESQAEKPDSISKGFKEFWEQIWPSHKRKTGRKDCEKVYRSACQGKHPKAEKIEPAELNRCARAYIASVRDLEYLKGTLAWLRLPGWEPFMQSPHPLTYSWDDLSMHQQNMLSDGRCPPSMKGEDGKPNAAARYWLKKFGVAA